MARTIYYRDGSREVLFSGEPDEKAADMERILRERLGDDTVSLFRETIQAYRDEIDALTEELKLLQ